MNRAIRHSGLVSIAIASLWLFAANAAAEPPNSGASRADRLAQTVFFEGVPFEQARDLSDADVARLIELLGDPAEIRAHPNILVALGMSGSPAAFDAIADYASRGSSGELDRLAFRAQRSIAFGMGHLARVDDRALAWLIRAATGAGAAPPQSFRQIDAERVAQLKRRAAITGLALSARPAAARLLGELIAAPGAGPGIAGYAGEALLLHARISREGPAAALRDAFGPDR